MKHLYLHVGHGKTGSSYLQSLLAHARPALGKAGLNYAGHQSLQAAKAGQVTSGNGVRLINAIEAQDYTGVWFHHAERSVFSSEFLFDFLVTDKNRDKFLHYIEKAKIDRVSILLFIRNPVDLVVSGYQQSVKRAGNSGTIDEYCAKIKLPIRVLQFLDKYQSDTDFEVTVKNYSVHRPDLDSCLWQFLNVENLTTPLPSTSVNRSLSLAELQLQRRINQVLGKSGTLFADRLCNELPEIKSEKFYPSMEEQVRLIERNRDAMEETNARIPEAEHYDIEPIVGPIQEPDTPVEFSAAQLEVIGAGLGGEIKRLRAQLRQAERQLED